MSTETPAPDPSKLLEAFFASDRSERAFAALVTRLFPALRSGPMAVTGGIPPKANS